MTSPLDSPFLFGAGRDKIFFEAKRLVEGQFPKAGEPEKMALIGSLMHSFCLLQSSQLVASELSGSLSDIAAAIREVGER